MNTSKVAANPPVKPRNLFARIRCPVDEIGRNSVTPFDYSKDYCYQVFVHLCGIVWRIAPGRICPGA